MNFQDLTGQKFSNLMVIDFNSQQGRKSCWNCKCICGKIISVRSDSLKNGHTKSCGCVRKPKAIKHGLIHTSEYGSWARMIQRCTNPKSKGFFRYGGRGIKICDRWLHSFENFYADMGKKPSAGHSIDRINNDGNYEATNCRWATSMEQADNTRQTVHEEIDGIILNRTAMAKYIGIDKSTMYDYYKKGYTTKEIKSIFDKRKTA